MENQKVIQDLQDQQAARDPFQRAQAMYQNKQQLADPLSQSPIGSGGLDQSQINNPQASTSISTLYNSQDSSMSEDGKNAILNMLKGSGIPSDGLQFNQLGKIQLQGRLQGKFGPQYADNIQAKQILEAFDKYSGQSPDGQAQQQAAESGKRTLAALLGGQA